MRRECPDQRECLQGEHMARGLLERFECLRGGFRALEGAFGAAEHCQAGDLVLAPGKREQRLHIVKARQRQRLRLGGQAARQHRARQRRVGAY